MAEHNISIRVSNEVYKAVKLRVLEKGCSLKDYLLELIKADIEKPLTLKAVPSNLSVSQESVKEAQKILDFVTSMMKRDGNE